MDAIEQRRNLERFGELVLADRALHDQLRATGGTGEFAMLAAQLGAERGCVFSPETVQEVLNERRRAWRERWIQ